MIQQDYNYFTLNGVKIRTFFYRNEEFAEIFNEETYCWELMEKEECSIDQEVERQLFSFDMLPADIIVYILSFQDFHFADPYDVNIDQFFGKFPDGTVRALVVNIAVQSMDTKEDLVNISILLRNAKIILFECAYCTEIVHLFMKNLGSIAPCFDALLFHPGETTEFMYECLIPYLDAIREIRMNDYGLFLVPLLRNVKKIILCECDLRVNNLRSLISNMKCNTLHLFNVFIEDTSYIFPLDAICKNKNLQHVEIATDERYLYPVSLEHISMISESSLKTFRCDLDDRAFEELTNNQTLEDIRITDTDSYQMIEDMTNLKAVEVFLDENNALEVAELVKSNLVKHVHAFLKNRYTAVGMDISEPIFNYLDLKELVTAAEYSDTKIKFYL
jgi:hypothetical protein